MYIIIYKAFFHSYNVYKSHLFHIIPFSVIYSGLFFTNYTFYLNIFHVQEEKGLCLQFHCFLKHPTKYKVCHTPGKERLFHF